MIVRKVNYDTRSQFKVQPIGPSVQKWVQRGYRSLPWLVNQPWNALALAYVTALRPYLTVFDVKSMGYRTLNLATVSAVRADRTTYSIVG